MSYAVIDSSNMSVTFHGLSYAPVKSRVLEIASVRRWQCVRILPVGEATLVDFLDYVDYQELVDHLYDSGFSVRLAVNEELDF